MSLSSSVLRKLASVLGPRTARELETALSAGSGAAPGLAMEVWRTTSQTIPDNTLTAIQWEAGAANSDLAESFFDGEEATTVTFHQAGMYVVTLSLDFAANGVGRRYVEILKTYGSGAAAATEVVPVSGQKTRISLSAQILVNDDPDPLGDFPPGGTAQMSVQVLQTSGGDLAVTEQFDVRGFAPCLMIARVGDAYDRSFGLGE